MLEFSAHIAQSPDCEAILDYAYRYCRDRASLWFSYHFTPVFESQTSKNTFIWARDVPERYQALYIGEDYRVRDPVPRLTFEFGPILTRRRAEELVPDGSDAAGYLAELASLGADNWVAFALFGPRNRDAYAVVEFDSDPDRFAEGALEEIQDILQIAHLRICSIIDEKEPAISLSEREREVLAWMGRGKSGQDIATILAISPETVRTYTRRLYEKLEANDRVTATVRALKLGLLDL